MEDKLIDIPPVIDIDAPIVERWIVVNSIDNWKGECGNTITYKSNNLKFTHLFKIKAIKLSESLAAKPTYKYMLKITVDAHIQNFTVPGTSKSGEGTIIVGIDEFKVKPYTETSYSLKVIGALSTTTSSTFSCSFSKWLLTTIRLNMSGEFSFSIPIKESDLENLVGSIAMSGKLYLKDSGTSEVISTLPLDINLHLLSKPLPRRYNLPDNLLVDIIPTDLWTGGLNRSNIPYYKSKSLLPPITYKPAIDEFLEIETSPGIEENIVNSNYHISFSHTPIKLPKKGSFPTFDNNFATLDYTGDKYIEIQRTEVVDGDGEDFFKIYDSNTLKYTYIYASSFRDGILPTKIIAVLQGAGNYGYTMEYDYGPDNSFGTGDSRYGEYFGKWAVGGASGATVPVVLDFSVNSSYFIFIGRGGISSNDVDGITPERPARTATDTYITNDLIYKKHRVVAECGKLPEKLQVRDEEILVTTKENLLNYRIFDFGGSLARYESNKKLSDPLKPNNENGMHVISPFSKTEIDDEYYRQPSTLDPIPSFPNKSNYEAKDWLRPIGKDICNEVQIFDSLICYYGYKGKNGPLVYFWPESQTNAVYTARDIFCDLNYKYEYSRGYRTEEEKLSVLGNTPTKFFDWEFDYSDYERYLIYPPIIQGWYDFQTYDPNIMSKHLFNNFELSRDSRYPVYDPEEDYTTPKPLSYLFKDFPNRYCGKCWTCSSNITFGYTSFSAGGAPSPFSNGGSLLGDPLHGTAEGGVTAYMIDDVNPCKNSAYAIKLIARQYDEKEVIEAKRGAGGAVVISPRSRNRNVTTAGGDGCVFLYY